MTSLSFTTRELIEWLKSQPDKPFDNTSAHRCAIAAFLQATSRAKQPLVINNCWRDAAAELDENFNPIYHRLPFSEATPHCSTFTYHELAQALETL